MSKGRGATQGAAMTGFPTVVQAEGGRRARLRLPQGVGDLLVRVPLPLHSSSSLEGYGTPIP